jgi:ribonuclease-3
MNQLEIKLEYTFIRQDLLALALSHSSVSGGGIKSRPESNERLEFLGDRVLGLTIAELVYKTFSNEPEGHLARRYTDLVRREALSEVGESLGIFQHVSLSPSERSAAKDKARESIVADTCEAIIAAIYLDGGYESASAFILRHWPPLMRVDMGPPVDSKTALQEWGQAKALPLPIYAETFRKGPAHAPVFAVEVSLDGHKATGYGKSKRAAEQESAKHLLEILDPTYGD